MKDSPGILYTDANQVNIWIVILRQFENNFLKTFSRGVGRDPVPPRASPKGSNRRTFFGHYKFKNLLGKT